MAATLQEHRANFNAKMLTPAGKRTTFTRSWVDQHDKREQLRTLARAVLDACNKVDYRYSGIGEIVHAMNNPHLHNPAVTESAQSHLALVEYTSYLVWDIGLDFYMVRAESNFILTGEKTDLVED